MELTESIFNLFQKITGKETKNGNVQETYAIISYVSGINIPYQMGAINPGYFRFFTENLKSLEEMSNFATLAAKDGLIIMVIKDINSRPDVEYVNAAKELLKENNTPITEHFVNVIANVMDVKKVTRELFYLVDYYSKEITYPVKPLVIPTSYNRSDGSFFVAPENEMEALSEFRRIDLLEYIKQIWHRR